MLEKATGSSSTRQDDVPAAVTSSSDIPDNVIHRVVDLKCRPVVVRLALCWLMQMQKRSLPVHSAMCVHKTQRVLTIKFVTPTNLVIRS